MNDIDRIREIVKELADSANGNESLAMEAYRIINRISSNPLIYFGHRVGTILSDRKVPAVWDPEHLTPDQVVIATAELLDKLDDATDEFLAAHGKDEHVERTMQEDLRKYFLNREVPS